MKKFNYLKGSLIRSIGTVFVIILFSIFHYSYGQLSVSKTDVTTGGANDGTASASLSGGTAPITYTWSNGGNTASISNLSGGTYCVTATDANNCSAYDCVNVFEPTALTVSVSGGNVHVPYCSDMAPPSITLTANASGGLPPYNYSWPGGSITVNSTNTYTVHAWDANNDHATGSAFVIFIPIFCAQDPNDIIGPEGYGPEQWVSITDNLNYTIRFENDPDFATAPAQKVIVYLPIDNKANKFSLRLSDFGFGDFNFQVPPNTTFYTNRLDVVDSLNVYVDVIAGLDVTNNRAFWIFESIDPNTGLAPQDAFTGFLLVNDSITHRGEGFVTFSLKPNSAAITTDSLFAKAEIIFDVNNPIETNEWFNTIDAVAPSSTVDPVLPYTDTNHIAITYTATDDQNGSGVDKCILYYSKNNGPWTIYGEYDPDTTTYFTANPAQYGVFSIARDYAGNLEAMKNTPETQFTIYDTIKFTVSGIITYDNSFNTPLTQTQANLLRSNILSDTAITNASGFYEFTDVEEGTYVLHAESGKLWGGVNATDALIINRSAIGLYTLSPFRAIAADVNGVNNITSTDALLTLRRSVGLDTSFSAGDWVFEKDTIIVLGDTLSNQDFIGICVGDVNGSYIPNTTKSTDIAVIYEGEMPSNTEKVYELPVRIDCPQGIGAVTLSFYYPVDIMQIEEVYSDKFGLLNHIIDGQIRIAWDSLIPVQFNEKEILLKIKYSLKEKAYSQAGIELILGYDSELADMYANILRNVTLILPVIIPSDDNYDHIPDQYILGYNFPNPFSHYTEITYSLPENGNVKLEVYNNIGELIEILVNENQVPGYYKIKFNGSNLAAGVYQYRIKVVGESRDFIESRTMIISKKQR